MSNKPEFHEILTEEVDDLLYVKGRILAFGLGRGGHTKSIVRGSQGFYDVYRGKARIMHDISLHSCVACYNKA